MKTRDVSNHFCFYSLQYIKFNISIILLCSEIRKTHYRFILYYASEYNELNYEDPLLYYRFNIIAGTTRVQFLVAYVMSIQKILSPLLIISYICGCRVAEFSTGVPRQFGFLYMLLLWSCYIFVYIYGIIPYTIHYSIVYHICFGINIFTALLTIIVAIYHDKAFKNCIKSLNIVDDTLEELGIITDYNKLRMRTLWLILGSFLITISIIGGKIRFLKDEYNTDITLLIYFPFMRRYCAYVNIISDFIITSMLGYVSLKFDQINEYLEKLNKSNDRIKRVWEHPVLLCHQSRYAKIPRIKYMIWILIHLHLELRKISYKINSIFGIQMTLEMGCCFGSIALASREIFNAILINDYINNNNKMLYITIILLWLSVDVFRLFLINYFCEKISSKANATGNIINKLSHFNCDVETRENILQFLLMIQSPIRFRGLGLFQFGFKFLQGFTTSVATVLVILVQSHMNK